MFLKLCLLILVLMVAHSFAASTESTKAPTKASVPKPSATRAVKKSEQPTAPQGVKTPAKPVKPTFAVRDIENVPNQSVSVKKDSSRSTSVKSAPVTLAISDSDTSIQKKALKTDSISHNTLVCDTPLIDSLSKIAAIDSAKVPSDTSLTIPVAAKNVVSSSPAQKHLEIKSALKKAPRPFNVIVKILLLVALCSILGAIVLFLLLRKQQPHFMTNTRLSIMDKEIQLAARYIETNYADQSLTVASLCASIVTGPAFLEALFMRDLGMGVEDFIEQVRVNRAKLHLDKDSSLSVDVLASLCGYTSADSLSLAFEHVTSVTLPSYIKTINAPHA